MSDDDDILQSVDISISVLMHVAKVPDISLSAIARDIGETKPRVMRMLRTLERRGMVRRNAQGHYRLGNSALVLGTAASTQNDLVRLASPVLESVGQNVQETVQLSIIDNFEALCIAKYEPTRDLRVHALIGRRRPLHAGSRKVLLAFLPPQVQAKLLPLKLERFTPETVVDPKRLLRELGVIREQGHCVSRGEVSEHLLSVSVPVLAPDGSLVASLNIVAPAFRTQKPDVERFVQILKDSAQRISDGLTY